jgi:hypothetical protein
MDTKAKQALEILYMASRRAPLTADEHKACEQSAVYLQDTLTPKTKEEAEAKSSTTPLKKK